MMVKINNQGYLERRNTKLTWYLVRQNDKGMAGRVELNYVSFPPHLVGRRVRFKVEVIEDDN